VGCVLEGVLSRKELSAALLPWWDDREKARKGEDDDKVLRMRKRSLISMCDGPGTAGNGPEK
jgi:hypothetical protein